MQIRFDSIKITKIGLSRPFGGRNGGQFPVVLKFSNLMRRQFSKESMVKT